MKRIDENGVSKEGTDKEKKDRILSFISLALSILAYPLTCILWLGIVLTVLAIVLGLVHEFYFKSNGIVRVALIISFIYVIAVLLCIIIFGIYRSILKI